MAENNFVPSLIGTLVAEIITLPICTVKTVYQNNSSFGSIRFVIKDIYTKYGIKGFIQASPHSLVSQLISTSTKYTFYHKIKEYRKTEPNDIISNSLNGMAGGVVGSLFSHPIDVWKNYAQRNQVFNFQSFDPKLYYQGYHASLYKNSVLYAILFPTYDYYKTKFNSTFVCSILTTLTVSTIIQPFDYYKTIRMAGNDVKINISGLKTFKRGFGLMLARSIPHFLITMMVTEKLKKLI
jgi:hypothetical protein